MKSWISSSENGGILRCGWSLLWCRGLRSRVFLRPGGPGCIFECVLLPEDIPRDHPITSLMLQEFPTLVVITISNEGPKPGVCPILELLSLVLLQVHIGQAAPHMEVSNIGLVAIPELKGGTAYCAVGELVVDVVGGMSSLCPQPSLLWPESR